MHVDTTDVLKTVSSFRIIIMMNILLVPLGDYTTVFHSI